MFNTNILYKLCLTWFNTTTNLKCVCIKRHSGCFSKKSYVLKDARSVYLYSYNRSKLLQQVSLINELT